MVLDRIDERSIDHVETFVAYERVGEVDLRLVLLLLLQALLLLFARAQPFAGIDANIECLARCYQTLVDCR